MTRAAKLESRIEKGLVSRSISSFRTDGEQKAWQTDLGGSKEPL